MVNYGSIDAKLQAYLNSAAGKKRVREYVRSCMLGLTVAPGGIHTPTEAADKFIEVLGQAIDSSGISEGVKESIKNLKCSRPEELSDGTYRIVVFFDTELDRPSLNGTDTLRDLAELYNDGVNHDMQQVWGYWHGELVGSRTTIPGTHFMETAVQNFMNSYAGEYNVKSLTVRR